MTKIEAPMGAGHNAPISPIDIDSKAFPDKAGRGDTVPCTIDNVRVMLAENGITVRYNSIKKKTEIAVPWVDGTTDNADSVSMAHIQSLASRYNMPTGLVAQMTEAIGDENYYNPAADWIRSKVWDGDSRLQAFCDTITPRENYPSTLRDVLIRKWLLSVTAAALQYPDFRCRGVLTLQGAQGIGKTSWGLSLIDDPLLRMQLIKTDHHIDPSNKDSLLGAVCNWIVELGEVESTFRRDVARLKGFITAGTDKIRRPYARVAAEYRRGTVFYATVNDSRFLVDDTGNTRWWTIPCEHIDFKHGIDMQQVFAECASLLKDGEIWWLTPEEERLLERENSHHRAFSLVRDKLAAVIDNDVTDLSNCRPLTASEVLQAAGIDRPTNGQAKECAALLREWFGESKRINGRDKWRVPIRRHINLGEIPDDEVLKAKPKSKFD